MSAYPFDCKICGRNSEETVLECIDADHDFFICKDGYGCKLSSKNVFKNIYTCLLLDGKKCSPRNEMTIEYENFSYIIPPYVRFISFSNRNFNLDYVKREFLWYLKGDKYDTSITKYAKMWEHFINSDGSINSNYGQYIFGNMNQFDKALYCLADDIDSRRAVIVILQPYHLLRDDMKEIPCTYCISFRIRNNRLNMTVRMRSQDAWVGFGSDIPIFSFIHEMMYVCLRDKFYPEIKYGNYCHSVDSFHIYGKHWEKAFDVIGDKVDYLQIECPKISSVEEIDYIRSLHLENYHKPLNYFKFAKWLTEFDNI